MTNDLIIPGEAVALQPRSFHAVALSAADVIPAQSRVIEYLEAQAAQTSLERQELELAIETAALAGWKTEAMERGRRRLEKRARYFVNLIAAVQHGYMIVPNMPVTVFAVRTKRKRPRAKAQSSTYSLGSAQRVTSAEEADQLAIGEGWYINPLQLGEEHTRQITAADGKTQKTEWTWIPTDFDEIEFPLAAAHPAVMSATQAAMALRIFDEIGIVPETRPKGDPIILGRIRLKDGHQERIVSCIIAWHLDLRTI